MTLHIFTYVHKIVSPFIVLPAHSKDQVCVCTIMLNSEKAGCRRLVLSALLIKVHRSLLKKIKLCLKSAILLHLSADPWSATGQLTQAQPPNVTHFPDSMSFGHMDNHTHSQPHTQKHLCRNTYTHKDDVKENKKWKNKVVAGEYSSI